MQDVYDRNITIYDEPGTEIWKQVMSTLPFPFPELAERIYISNSYDEFDNITKYDLLDKESYFYYIIPTTEIYLLKYYYFT